MREYRLDLHNHTPHVWSDYRSPEASPREIVEAALEAGVDVLGATDHFSVDYCRTLIEVAEDRARSGYARDTHARRLLVLPGAELRVRHGDDEVHLVALFAPESDFEGAFERLMYGHGMPREARSTDLLPSLAIVGDAGAVARDVVALGGMCHVAHADRRFGDYALCESTLLPTLVAEDAITAVEVLDLGSREVVSCLSSARLLRSSDAHAPDEIGRRTCDLALRELSFAGVRDALAGDAYSTLNAS